MLGSNFLPEWERYIYRENGVEEEVRHVHASDTKSKTDRDTGQVAKKKKKKSNFNIEKGLGGGQWGFRHKWGLQHFNLTNVTGLDVLESHWNWYLIRGQAEII